MKSSNFVLWVIATLFLALQSTWATQIIGGASGTAPPSKLPQSAERTGTIINIDLGRQVIVVDGGTYLFPATSVVVHSADPSVAGNPLKLRKGERIRFNTVKEPSGKERIVEIWVTRPSANQSK